MADAQVSVAEQPTEEKADARWVLPAVVGVYSLLGAVGGLFAAMFVPSYLNGVLFPVSLLITVVANVVLPRILLASGAGLAAVMPVVAFVLVTFVLASGRPENDVLMPGDGDVSWVTYGVLFGGAAVGFATIMFAGRRR